MNPLDALREPFLQNALAAGLIVAVAAGALGYFIVLRGAAFATHALAQIGFAGAAGAVLVGAAPLAGLLTFALLGAVALGTADPRGRARDATTALILVFALGLGALFLALAHGYATDAFALLFGTIVGVDRAAVAITAAAAALAAIGLAVIGRPLVLASVAPDIARIRGVPLGALDLAFYGLVALVAAIAVPIVGTLLIYSLAIGPAAAAARLTRRPTASIAVAIGLGALAVVVGVALAAATGWPVGFFIATATALEYGVARIAARALTGRSESA